MHHHLGLRGKLIIMMSVMASLFLVALDQTIIATALGKIVEEFDAFSALSWIVTAYLLTTTITVPIAGKLSDLFGRRILLLVGVAIFALGSLFSGMASDINMLIYARAFQGIGGGIITANAFTIVGDLFSARERGRWQGLIGAVFGLSSVVGPLLGGWLTEPHNLFGLVTNWRWTFYINVPVAIIAFLLLTIFCPTLKSDKKPSIDYWGATLLTVALGTLILAVDNTESIFSGFLEASGWSLVQLRLLMAAIVAASVTGFILVEKRAAQPIVPLEFFKNRNFVLIMGIATLFGAAFMGAILYLTQFNQQVFGASPTESGLMLLPMIGGLMFTSIVSGQIISRTGRYKIFMQVGIVVAAVMVGLMATLNPESSYLFEAGAMLVLGAGLGVVMPVMTLAVQNEFKQRELGVATSSSQLFRSLGTTVGVAVLGALLTGGITTSLGPNIDQDPYVKAIASSPAMERIGDVSDPDVLLNLNMKSTKQKIEAGFEKSIQQLPAEDQKAATKKFETERQNYADKIIQAFSDSLSRIFIVSALLMSAAAVLVFMLKERTLREASPEDTPGEA